MTIPPLSLTELDRRNSLQLKVREQFMQFRARAWRVLQVQLYLVSALRGFDDQEGLYELGRTRPGHIVTNSRPGQSWHNFGLAFDIALMSGGAVSFDAPITEPLAELAEDCSLEWGGRWTSFRDENHFQLLDGLTLLGAMQRWPEGWIPV